MSLLSLNNNSSAANPPLERPEYPSYLPVQAQDLIGSALDIVGALQDPTRTDTLVTLYTVEKQDLESVLNIIQQLNAVKRTIQKRIRLIDKSLMDLQPAPEPNVVEKTNDDNVKPRRKKPEVVPEDLENINAISDFD